jgi:hypothetical protein
MSLLKLIEVIIEQFTLKLMTLGMKSIEFFRQLMLPITTSVADNQEFKDQKP